MLIVAYAPVLLMALAWPISLAAGQADSLSDNRDPVAEPPASPPGIGPGRSPARPY